MVNPPRENARGGTHLGGATAGDDGAVLDRAPDDLNRVVQTPLHLRDELLGPAAEDQSARARLRAPFKEVVPLGADLLLLKDVARAEVFGSQVGHGRLDRAADGADDALQVVGRDAAGAKDVSVGKILRREVADRQTRQDYGRARLGDQFEFAVDDGPLGVDDRLVFLSAGRFRTLVQHLAHLPRKTVGDPPRLARRGLRRCRARL